MRTHLQYRRCSICRVVLKHTFDRFSSRRVSGSWLTVATLCRPCANAVKDIVAEVRAEYR